MMTLCDDDESKVFCTFGSGTEQLSSQTISVNPIQSTSLVACPQAKIFCVKYNAAQSCLLAKSMECLVFLSQI